MPYCGAGLPPGCMLKVKLKIGEQWFDTPGTMVVRFYLVCSVLHKTCLRSTHEHQYAGNASDLFACIT